MKWLRIACEESRIEDLDDVGVLLVPLAALTFHIENGVICGVQALETRLNKVSLVDAGFAVTEDLTCFNIAAWKARSPEELLLQAELHRCVAGGEELDEDEKSALKSSTDRIKTLLAENAELKERNRKLQHAVNKFKKLVPGDL